MPLRASVPLVASLFALGTIGPIALPESGADPQKPNHLRVVELRVYTLKPGTRDRFHQLFLEEALPMLRRWNVDVVAYGPSLHDDDSYYLLRAFPSVAERARDEEAFYGSAEWKNGPRQQVLAAIQSYSTAVVSLDEQGVQALRQLVQPESAVEIERGGAMQNALDNSISKASDLAALLALNDDYVRSVERSDVKRFREILADDFVCSLSDGSQLDRDLFLQHIAEPSKISNLEAHDVNVRLMGDFAIVHARTTFRMADGRSGASRYTDVWARRDGRWVAVAAQVTRY
jgi:ketosteroid isomerase-like protein